MTPITIPLILIRRPRKRGHAAHGPTATFQITCTTSKGGHGWMHQLVVCSADELRRAVLRDLDDVAEQVWGA
jgi:hypothetical protein